MEQCLARLESLHNLANESNELLKWFDRERGKEKEREGKRSSLRDETLNEDER